MVARPGAYRPVEVVAPPVVYRPRRRGLLVRVRTLLPDDVAMCRGLEVTSPAQTGPDLADVVPSADLVAIGDALLRTDRPDAWCATTDSTPACRPQVQLPTRDALG